MILYLKGAFHIKKKTKIWTLEGGKVGCVGEYLIIESFDIFSPFQGSTNPWHVENMASTWKQFQDILLVPKLELLGCRHLLFLEVLFHSREILSLAH